MKYFAGLDVSLNETAVCVIDEDGIIVGEGKAASEPDDLAAVCGLIANASRRPRVIAAVSDADRQP